MSNYPAWQIKKGEHRLGKRISHISRASSVGAGPALKSKLSSSIVLPGARVFPAPASAGFKVPRTPTAVSQSLKF